jgi:hypothetical protein
MSARISDPIRESLRIAGEKVSRDRVIEVRHPYSGELDRVPSPKPRSRT